MAFLPMDQGTRIGQQAGFRRIEFRGQRTQFLETHLDRRRERFVDLDQYAAAFFEPTKQNHGRIRCLLHERMTMVDERRPQRIRIDSQRHTPTQ